MIVFLIYRQLKRLERLPERLIACFLLFGSVRFQRRHGEHGLYQIDSMASDRPRPGQFAALRVHGNAKQTQERQRSLAGIVMQWHFRVLIACRVVRHALLAIIGADFGSADRLALRLDDKQVRAFIGDFLRPLEAERLVLFRDAFERQNRRPLIGLQGIRRRHFLQNVLRLRVGSAGRRGKSAREGQGTALTRPQQGRCLIADFAFW